MSNLENNTIATIKDRLAQLKEAREEKFKSIIIEQGLPVDSESFVEYVKQHIKFSDSNTTEE